MIEAICAHVHNYFTAAEDIHAGTWTISSGAIDLSALLQNGQYFRIVGSAMNDGIYQYPAQPEQGRPPILVDETFEGEIWAMKVPRAVVNLAAEIAAWQQKYGAAAASPYQSESFGGYSYTKAAGASGSAAGDADAWKGVFRSRLNEWRKLQ
jgi:hypothetical protein